MRLSAIVCTFNRCEVLRETLRTLDESQLPPGVDWEVLVVDNNSSDGTRSVCESFVERNPGRFRYFFEPRAGKTFALNTGIANAQGEILAFTDDDVKVDPRWLAEVLRAFEKFACAGIAGRIVPVWNSDKPIWYSSEGPYKLMDAICRYDFGDEPCVPPVPAYGANLSLKRQMLERYGGFRTDLGPTPGKQNPGEDAEMCRRLVAAGEKFMYAPRAIIYHPVEEKRTKKSYFQSWYFEYGCTMVRMGRVDDAPARYLGIPRYMYRMLAAEFLQWIVALEPKKRFYHKLQTYQIAGEMAEWRRVRRKQRVEGQAVGA
ncbi:MAG: glycosyltransferase [Candidatus Acidiferrales bacterium]